MPVNVVMENPDATFGIDELADVGVKRISVGSALAQLAYGSLVAAAREMVKSGRFDFTKDVIGFDELEAFFKRPRGE